MATNPILQQIAQLLSPTTAPWAPGPFGTPPFNPNAPMAGAQPQAPAQPAVPPAEPATETKKPKGKLARVGAALTDPRVTAFSMGTASALNRPRQQGESEMQQLTSGVLGGYGGLQNLAMMQEAARQQALKERLAVAEAMRAGAATQSNINLQGTQAAQNTVETQQIPKRTAVAERGATVAERGAASEEKRVEISDRNASSEERRVQLAETQMMENTAQAKKQYDLEVAKLTEARAKRIDERKLGEMRVAVDKQQNAIAAARLGHEAQRLKNELEAKGDIRKAGLVDSAMAAAKAQVTLMNDSLGTPMSAEQLEAAYIKSFNRYVQQLSLGTGIPINTEAFGGAQDPTANQQPIKWKKDAQGRPVRDTGN